MTGAPVPAVVGSRSRVLVVTLDRVAEQMAGPAIRAWEIATFLSGANPNLPKDVLLGLLTTHVGHHAAQVDEIMKGDMQSEAATWKAMQGHMNVIADALADGIAKQFPNKAT